MSKRTTLFPLAVPLIIPNWINTWLKIKFLFVEKMAENQFQVTPDEEESPGSTNSALGSFFAPNKTKQSGVKKWRQLLFVGVNYFADCHEIKVESCPINFHRIKS